MAITLDISQPHGNGTFLTWKSFSDYPLYQLRNEARDLVVEYWSNANTVRTRRIENFFSDALLKRLTISDSGDIYQGTTLIYSPDHAVPDTNIRLTLGSDLSGNPWPGPVGNYSLSGLHAGATVQSRDFLSTREVSFSSHSLYYRTPHAGLLPGPKDNMEEKPSFSEAFGYPWLWVQVHYPEQKQIRVYKVTDGSTHRPLGDTSYVPSIELVWVKSWPSIWKPKQVSPTFTSQGDLLVATLTAEGVASVVNRAGDHQYVLQNRFHLYKVQSILLLDTSFYYGDLSGNVILIALESDNRHLSFYDLDVPKISPLDRISLTTEFPYTNLPLGGWILETFHVLPPSTPEEDSILEISLWSRTHGRRYARFIVTQSEVYYWLADDEDGPSFWSGDDPAEEYETYWVR